MEMKQEIRILYCHCAYAAILTPHVKEDVCRALTESGISFETVPDLCELAARKDPRLAEFASASRLVIAACHPRAVKWLFAAGGTPLRQECVVYLDMRETSIEPLLPAIRDLAAPGNVSEDSFGNPSSSALHRDPDPFVEEGGYSGNPEWKPWFPVIDRSLCTNCNQCLGFCLFGVYAAAADGRVEVANPTHCKTDCPACARICPETAILFPKYTKAPINGGELKEGEQQEESLQVDKAVLAQGDVLAILRERGRSRPRFSSEPGRWKAIQERMAHLKQSQQPSDVPPDALTAIPSDGKESQ